MIPRRRHVYHRPVAGSKAIRCCEINVESLSFLTSGSKGHLQRWLWITSGHAPFQLKRLLETCIGVLYIDKQYTLKVILATAGRSVGESNKIRVFRGRVRIGRWSTNGGPFSGRLLAEFQVGDGLGALVDRIVLRERLESHAVHLRQPLRIGLAVRVAPRQSTGSFRVDGATHRKRKVGQTRGLGVMKNGRNRTKTTNTKSTLKSKLKQISHWMRPKVE